MSSLLIDNIACVVQAENQPRSVVKGADMAQLPCLENAWLWAENGVIQRFGPMSECPERKADAHIDASGRFLFPSWCDSHTHIVYAQSRERDFVDRIKGLTYQEIARRGGGILSSARHIESASEEDLYQSAWARLQEVVGYGTGALEIKSGYGLSFDGEMKMLRVIQRLKAKSPIPIKSTFLGAHAIPPPYRENRNGYITEITDKMLPYIADHGLADYCDVFCDEGFFTVAETDIILKKAAQYGMKARIHANELANSGGVQVAVANNALSADHLEHVGEAEIAAFKASDTMPTLLPGTAFFLDIPYAPARRMIDAGLPVALASDYNPGSSPSGNMPFVLSLACLKMKMLPEEAVQAATLNGARAMEMEKELGTIYPGKRANLFLTRPMPSLAFLPYAFHSDVVETVILDGEIFLNKG
jgi:imidazolonepropionase